MFSITKANNGFSTQPGMSGWAYGEEPSEPSMGKPRFGAVVHVAYRAEGADVSTETATRPEFPGKYIARFWVDEEANFRGTSTEIKFGITGTAPAIDHTTTTPVPVPYAWLEPYVAEFGGGKTGPEGYETAGWATGRNGVKLWESYVAGLDPTDAASRFLAIITMDADDEPVTDANRASMRFFKVGVEIK